MPRRWLLWCLLGLALVLLLYLGSQATVPGFVLLRGEQRERIEGENWPRTLVDAYSERTQLSRPPRRIVSVMLAADEMLLDLLPRDRIAGVTIYATMTGVANCIDQAQGLPQISSLDVEQVLPLEPDLVLAARFSSSAAVDTLRSAGVPVFRFGKYDSLCDIRDNVLLLGRAFDAEPRAREMVAAMDRTLDEVRQRARGRPTLRVLYYNGGWTAGAGTLFDEMLTLAGGQNVASEAGLTGHTSISLELVSALDPEVIVLPTTFGPDGKPSFDPRQSLLANPAWGELTAVKRQRLYVLPAQHLTCISHHVVKGAVDLARALHP